MSTHNLPDVCGPSSSARLLSEFASTLKRPSGSPVRRAARYLQESFWKDMQRWLIRHPEAALLSAAICGFALGRAIRSR